jgi:hypothetical protein
MAKAKKVSRQSLEVQALDRATFIPYGILYEVSLEYFFLSVHGVSMSLSFNECLLIV